MSSNYTKRALGLTKDDEPVRWITVRGKHIPIYGGESKGEAVQRALGGKGKRRGSGGGGRKRETREERHERIKREGDMEPEEVAADRKVRRANERYKREAHGIYREMASTHDKIADEYKKKGDFDNYMRAKLDAERARRKADKTKKSLDAAEISKLRKAWMVEFNLTRLVE